MGSLSIQKGKRAERQVASLLNPILERACGKHGCDPVKLQRNLKQVQEGGFDLDGLPWIAIEVKHCKTPALPAWWRQCVQQATQGRLPVLIYKIHGAKWRVRMIGELPVAPDVPAVEALVDIEIDDFLEWFEARVDHELGKDTAGIF